VTSSTTGHHRRQRTRSPPALPSIGHPGDGEVVPVDGRPSTGPASSCGTPKAARARHRRHHPEVRASSTPDPSTHQVKPGQPQAPRQRRRRRHGRVRPRQPVIQTWHRGPGAPPPIDSALGMESAALAGPIGKDGSNLTAVAGLASFRHPRSRTGQLIDQPVKRGGPVQRASRTGVPLNRVFRHLLNGRRRYHGTPTAPFRRACDRRRAMLLASSSAVRTRPQRRD